MTWLIVLAFVTAWLVVLVVTVALCRAAARADERASRLVVAARRHQQENQG